MKALQRLVATFVLAALVIPSARAVLLPRDLDGNGGTDAYYDSALDITWLRDWNAAAGSAFDNGSSPADGRLTWANAKAWAASLSLGGHTDWRLPAMIDSGSAGCTFSYGGGSVADGFDCGYNALTKGGDPTQWSSGDIIYSEMAHLYYQTLGNGGACKPTPDSTVDSCAGDPDWSYNSLAKYAATNGGDEPFRNLTAYIYWSGLGYQPDTGGAWGFYFGDGGQFAYGDNEFYAVAVRSGDIARTVSEPGGLLLLLLAAAAGALAKRCVAKDKWLQRPGCRSGGSKPRIPGAYLNAGSA